MSSPVLDREALLDTVDQDADFLQTLVSAFLDDCPSYMAAIRQAVADEDAQTLIREAHGLKGAVANLRAPSAREAARRLEEMGQEASFEHAPKALEELEKEIDRLRVALKDLVGEMQENT